MAERAELHSAEAERRVLAILSDTSVSRPEEARGLLDKHPVGADDFYRAEHAEVFVAIDRLIAARNPADPFAIWEAVKSSRAVKQAGGDAWLTKLLVNEGWFDIHFASAAKSVRELSLLRRIDGVAKRIQSAVRDAEMEPSDVLAGGTAALSALVRKGATYRTLTEVLLEMTDDLDEVQRGAKTPVIATGIEKLDEVIGGLQSKKLTFIGALPGIGKSALLATIARNLARAGINVGLFSLEDRADWLGYRLLADHSGIDVHVLRHRQKRDYQLDKIATGMDVMSQYAGRVYLDDREGLTPQEIATTMRDMAVNRGVKVFLIDHAGEMSFERTHRDRQDLNIMEGYRLLRAVAKQHDVPVAIAAHLTREAAQRKVPLLTDFAHAAAAERMARVALALTRDNTGRLVVWVLKQTEGQANVRVVLDFHGPAALVKNVGGFIDNAGEAA